MATSNDFNARNRQREKLASDFEARRRERLAQQRIRRQHMRTLKIALSVVLCVIIIVIISISAVRCSKKDIREQDSSIVTTQATPLPTAHTETATISPLTAGSLPTPQKGENSLIDLIASSGEKMHAYLTFDDGPSVDVTPKILDVLRKYDIKATFFMTGKSINAAPYLCTRVMEEGHLAAVHTYTHDPATVYSDESTFIDEIDGTYNLITANAPEGVGVPLLFRFPGGSDKNTKYGTAKQEYKDTLANKGYYYVDYNSYISDDSNPSASASTLLKNFNSTRPVGKNLIIQMHDTKANTTTVEMLDLLIQQLISEGYTFHRLDDIDFTNASSSTSTVSPKTTETANGGSMEKSSTKSNLTAVTSAPSTSKPSGTSSTSNTSTGGTANTNTSSSSTKSSASSSSGKSNTSSSTSSTSSSSKSGGDKSSSSSGIATSENSTGTKSTSDTSSSTSSNNSNELQSE